MEVLSFEHTYRELLRELLYSPKAIKQFNERTGTEIRTLVGGVSFKISSEGFLPMINLRKTYPYIAAAEVAWMLSGTKSISWLQKYAKIWDKFAEKNGTVKNAYGHRWLHHFKVNQIENALMALEDDSTNRRIYITAWDPAEDIPHTDSGLKNVACPVGFTLSIIGGRLHSSLLLRSSDVFVGLPYDIMVQTLLQKALANSLGVGLGTLHVTLAHVHIYKNHYEQAHEAFRILKPPSLICHLSGYTIEDIQASPDEYVQRYKEAATFPENMYNPKVDIVI